MEAEFNAIYQPVGPEENGFVREMVAAQWRIQRIGTAEAAGIDLEMVRQQPEIEMEFASADPGIVLGLAIRTLADQSRCLALISRYESRLRRTRDRARKTLLELQRQRKSQSAETAPAPEPLPTPPLPPEPGPNSLTENTAASRCAPEKKLQSEPTERRSLRCLFDRVVRFSIRVYQCPSVAKKRTSDLVSCFA